MKCYFSFSLPVLILSIIIYTSNLSQTANAIDVSVENPVTLFTPSHYVINENNDAALCERIKVVGRSRLQLKHYAHSLHLSVTPNTTIPEKFQSKIQICFHGNSSLEPCNCEADHWKPLQKGLWTSSMSPYQHKYIDIMLFTQTPEKLSISLEEVPQLWRLFFLAIGFALILLAPLLSSSVPFYYSTSMAIGVFLVIIILLFQGMKLLPTGKKNFLYLSLYSSVVGFGTFVLHYLSMFVNSILVNLGLSEELRHPVYVFVGACIAIAGAGLGYWMVRKFVISKDGRVDSGVSQFVKWAMRVVGSTLILQSTMDLPLMGAALILSFGTCFLVKKLRSSFSGTRLHPARKATRAEFLSKSSKSSPVGSWKVTHRTPSWSRSPVKGLVSGSPWSWSTDAQDHYSTFHKVTKRRKYTPQEWEDFTRDSTQRALADWAGSAQVASWLVENADRIHLAPSDCSSGGSSESESNSAEYASRSRRVGLFGW